MEKCISCGREIGGIENSVIFLCPNCGEEKIVRCGRCRKIGAKYKCPKCGFEGP